MADDDRLPLIVNMQIVELQNGVLLTITNDARPSSSDPMAQRHLRVGPLYYPCTDDALNAAGPLARDALRDRKEADDRSLERALRNQERHSQPASTVREI
jgi:hypothetical protein